MVLCQFYRFERKPLRPRMFFKLILGLQFKSCVYSGSLKTSNSTLLSSPEKTCTFYQRRITCEKFTWEKIPAKRTIYLKVMHFHESAARQRALTFRMCTLRTLCHDRSWLAPSSYYYTIQLVLTYMRAYEHRLHDIQDWRGNLKSTRKIWSRKRFYLFSGISWRMPEYNPLSCPLATKKFSVCHSKSFLSVTLVASVLSSYLLTWFSIFIDHLME